MGHRVNAATVTATKIHCTKSPQSALSSSRIIGDDASILDTKDVLSSMSILPRYSVLFKEAHTAIFSDSGPLPVYSRHYIAMMAASVAGCSDLASLERSLFLTSGGSPDWLRNCPAKLLKLEEINSLLCKSPRLIRPHHVKNLTDGDESFSISEIMQALVLLIHTHALSTFLLATTNTKIATKPANGAVKNGLQKICERKSIEFLDISDKSLETKLWKAVQPKELKRKRSFSEGELPGAKETLDEGTNGVKRPQKPSACVLQQFDKGNGDIRIQDYCWDEHGYSVLSTFYQELAVIFDDKLRAIKSLINKQQEDKNSKVIIAAWYFVQCIFGVHHDDFNYGEIDQVLDAGNQDMIRSCCNQPSSGKQQVSAVSGLSRDQHLQLNIVMMEARFLSEILFATQSVMKHMS